MSDNDTIEIEATQRPRSTAMAVASASIVNLHDFDQVWRFAKMIADTEMVPQHFQKKPHAIIVAIQWGLEIGVPPMQALQNIAVINGRPSIWGDLGKAIVQAHPELAGYSEKYDPDLKVAFVTIKRRRSNGAEIEITGDFSWQDAIDAKLTTKNTYQQYARDMLMWRAFWRAARATFGDALRGLGGAEESRDLETVKPAKVSGISDAAIELNDSLRAVATEEKPAPKPEPRDKRVKDGLVKQCETHFDMMSVEEDRRLAIAADYVTVPESAKTIRGLPVEALAKLEAELAKEVGGS